MGPSEALEQGYIDARQVRPPNCDRGHGLFPMTVAGFSIGRLFVTGGAGVSGLALGEAGRDAVAQVITRAPLWRLVTDVSHSDAVTRMADATRDLFPKVHDEIGALAAGLHLPFAAVFAWNARGDLLAGAGEGCTTVQRPGATPVLAHNEDGLPGLAGSCFLAEVQPEDAPAFMSFCYPGSIPGHSFAVTGAGLVITVNNLRLHGLTPEVPRMVLTRALLAAPDRAAAVGMLQSAPGSGGFHLSIGQAGQADIWSVSFGGGEVRVVRCQTPAIHANHALVDGAVLSRQTVTASSRDRLARGRALLAAGADALDILNDTGGVGLPILRRAPDDPDDENTLAQFHARIGAQGVDWSVHEPGQTCAAHAGHMPARQRAFHG